MQNLSELLDIAIKHASTHLGATTVKEPEIVERVEMVCRNVRNRACVRLLLSCLLAKIHKPEVDIRKPYTEIRDSDSYSGRTYDEKYIAQFIAKYDLPCNPTTAFLTPALRNRNIILTPDVELEGRPKDLYKNTLQLLTDVHANRVAADDLLVETIRCLLNFRNERQQRIQALLAGLKPSEDALPLSSENIVTLIQQHLNCRGSSRLPVLVVAAAYHAAEKHLGERILPLQAHTAADEQTGAMGDIEITLLCDDDIITSYEMKMKKVTNLDIDRALQKIKNGGKRIDNYIFITTEPFDDEVANYAKSIYEKTDGIEMVILDCVGFLRHFLHLFHRLRFQFLEAYQKLLLEEPESSVRQELKEAFLALRHAAESGE